MLRLNTILSLGILVFLLPFLGFPQSFDNFLYVISGFIIAVSAFLLKTGFNIKERIAREKEIEKDIQ